MSNLAKLEIAALDVSGNNYLTWALDAQLHLKAHETIDTIDRSKTTTDDKKAKALIFLRHHIHNNLKNEYITSQDPADLWESLKERFDHQKYVILPKARHDWLNLRFQDYKNVCDYNSALFRITSTLSVCGEKVSEWDKIEKTLTTFHPGNVSLQQQYRASNFTKYAELMQVLLVAEQNNQLVIMNHSLRPTGSAPFPEANVALSNYNNRERRDHGRGRGRSRGRGRGRGRGHGRGQGRGFQMNQFHAGINKFRGNEVGRVTKGQTENACYRCGMKGHWSRTCRTPKHLADLYQESQKTKGKAVETNFINNEAGPSFDGATDDTYLDIADFTVDIGNVNENQGE